MLVLEKQRKKHDKEGDGALFWFALATARMETETMLCAVSYGVSLSLLIRNLIVS
jgi:hypothetical protein